MDRVSLCKLMLIIFALPAQYFISQNWSNDNLQRSEELKNLFESINNFKENYLSLDKWAKWYISFVVDFPNRNLKRNLFDIPIDFDDDIAVEVLTYRKQLTDFGESAKTRSPRPSNVKYRVGQVIKHKNFDLYGVIIGWDIEANAPATWLKRNYNEIDADRLVKQPHYLILVDEKFQKKFTGKAYIAQEHIEIVSNYKVKHSNLLAYFSGSYNGHQYTSKKFLRTVYPHD